MADLTVSGDMDFEATSLQRCMIYKDPDLTCGEALTKGQPCYIKDTDGKAYKAVSTVGKFHGFAYDTYAVGDKVVLVGPGGKMLYTAAAGLTPGQPVYISGTAGKVSDVVISALAPIGFAVSDQSIIITDPVLVTVS